MPTKKPTTQEKFYASTGTKEMPKATKKTMPKMKSKKKC